MKSFFLFTVTALCFFSCSTNKNTPDNEAVVNSEIMNENKKTIWVNKYRTACMGMAPMMCLQVQEGDKVNPKKWGFTFEGIEGFDFVPGKLYKLLIEEIHLDPNLVPADGSSIRQKLIEVIEVIESPDDILDGKWEAIEIMGLDHELIQSTTPFLSIDGNKIGGTDGCNRIMSSLTDSDYYTFKLTAIAQTKMLCGNETMNVANAFTKQLRMVEHYSIEDKVLLLHNKEGLVVLKFKRG